MEIKIRRGTDIPFQGAPSKEVRAGPAIGSVAVLGEDFPGLRPVFFVEEGAEVAAGQRLFADRRRPEIVHVAPVAGTVTRIARGRRRSLDSLLIVPHGEAALSFAVPSRPDRAALIALLCESGSWPAFRARPFGRVPDPERVPEAIFVTAIDTAPLAGDPAIVIARHADWFERGAAALHVLTEGKVYLCHAAGASLPAVDGVEPVGFAGPHPAGLPGTHIHHLHPVAGGGSVWQIGYQDVIAIGCLIETGRIWTERVVALAGPAVRDPCLLVTLPGASLRDLSAGLLAEAGARLLSGSPLDGRPERYLGRYHLQVSALPPHPPASARRPLARRLAAFAGRGVPAVVPNAAHERVAPARILPIPFLRAIGIGDTQTARRLGALELVEEDMALLAHVDGGAGYGALLRRTLDELEAMQ